VLPADVVERLRARGGKVTGTLADLGKVIGAEPRTTAHRVMHALADARLVRLATGPAGISVAVL